MVSGLFRQDFSCFLHPQRKHSEFPEHCPDCNLPYDFPLTMAPTEIAGRRIAKGLSRGFYGAVFQAEHPTIRGRRSAMKVIPKATYASHDEGGYEKDFYAEAELYNSLSAIDLVARLLDAGECDVTFGQHKIACYWLEMEYVRGPVLNDLVKAGPENPRIIATIASDLLDLVGQLQQRNKHHNDLHGGNVKVVFLERDQERGAAIAKNVQTKILDLGSVAEASKSGTGRWSDVHQVANHILELTAAYERCATAVEPGEQRICARLRQIAQQWCAIDDDSRRPRPHDLKASLVAACTYAEQWWQESAHLDSLAADINAVTMPSHRAYALFCGPRRWGDSMAEPGTKLLTGMRGCGKTMLLRSLHWQARIFQYENEDRDAVERRVSEDQFLALFVSCATLLRGPRPTHTPELVMHRLFLAFVLEVIHFIQTCDLRKIGSFYQGTCGRLNELLQRMVPWYESPADPTDLYEVERHLLNAVNRIPRNTANIEELNPREAFEDLTTVTRSWGDIVRNKRLLFLLDDVSVRYMSKESVEAILRHLCFQSSLFSFKLSTETQTLALHAPGEKLAQIGRDYDVFDLGEEVFAILRDRKERVPFIQSVLAKRARQTIGLPDYQRADPGYVLGRRTLKSVALDIRGKRNGRKSSEKFCYWGLDALVGICVGDLGEIITIYERMLQHVSAGARRVGAQHQHKELLDFAEGRLRALAVRDPWLYTHAIAFAQASHRELLASGPKRVRQYAEVDVTIGIDEADSLFPRIVELIDAGVFVATGATSRMKSKEPSLQFKLAYRKLLGLTHRIPLSMRDRFELPSSRLRRWLETPDSGALRGQKRSGLGDDSIDDEEEDEIEQTSVLELFAGQEEEPKQEDATVVDNGSCGASPGQNGIRPQVLYDVESREVSKIEMEVVLRNACVIGAIGFEERSVGSWENILGMGVPRSAVLLRYPDPGRINAETGARLDKLLDGTGVNRMIIDVDAVPEEESLQKVYLRAAESSPIVLDITSMTKPLIFGLISRVLRLRNEVHVVHTCAADYFPVDDELKSVAGLLTRGLDDGDNPKHLQETFSELDRMVTGEQGPYKCVRIGSTHADPSQPGFLAALISLKHEPIRIVFEQGQVERSAIIYPLHSSGEGALRSRVARELAEFLAQLHHGQAIPLPSLDHVAAFQTLVGLHRLWSLEDSFNFELSLTGTKMHTVGAAMFASTVLPASVYYARASAFDVKTFTKGTACTQVILLRRVERKQ